MGTNSAAARRFSVAAALALVAAAAFAAAVALVGCGVTHSAALTADVTAIQLDGAGMGHSDYHW